MKRTRQLALGQYGFTRSGAPAAKEARIDLRFELMPELWAMVFDNFEHPVFLLMIIGVCKMWRDLGLGSFVRLLRTSNLLWAQARDPGTYGRYRSLVAFRDRVYFYAQDLNTDGQLFIEIHMSDTCDIRHQEPGDTVTKIVIQFEGTVGCDKCGRMFPRKSFSQHSFIIGNYKFCSNTCLAVAVAYWADHVPLCHMDYD